MSEYAKAYQAATGKMAPHNLDTLFDQIKAGTLLPPRGQQAVDAGLTAHALTDPRVAPAVYHYYDWVVNHYLQQPVNELSAKLIGMALTAANVFATNLPQPLTINPWQVPELMNWPLATERAVVIENNGVFIWLHHLHPTWPLIDQGGNDFQPAYVTLLNAMVAQGLHLAYLGDLDATGIRIADTLVHAVPAKDWLAIQTPQQVSNWLIFHGKTDPQRTKLQAVRDPQLKEEMRSVAVTFRQFVEQEQLIPDYERLIQNWLG
ncbi:DUF2399 domain-containing protein [Lacticaseibacillus jixiensis]|uniref:DUF2399 domain-containing protein n=1 Tax=Lacticaseibacillus jixiensis TaxID=3231926 RepID=UPI0036F27746